MPPIPSLFENARVTLKANIYFDGKVVSHAIVAQDGLRRTVGLIYPGTFRFTTDAPERMDVIAGECRVRQAGASDWTLVKAGNGFSVPARSSFDIAVDQGIAEYLCTFG